MKKIKKINKIITTLLKYYYYKFYCIIKKIDTYDYWIISERGDDARDNGYHLFKYIRNVHPEIKVKYIISKKSKDYEKVRKLGEIIDYNSKEHYIAFLKSKMLISTHIMGFSPDMSLFWRMDKKKLLKINGKKIFLQHGVIKDFLPMLTSNFAKLDMFVTTTNDEYEYVLNNYGFDDKVIKCTGLPRYDNLPTQHVASRTILFMPTFRKWLNYYTDDEFMESTYYKEIDYILNSSDINELLEKYNYNLIFYPHYETQKRLHLFSTNSKRITIASFNNYDVQKLLIDCDLLITDFSSVFFDFCYMNKPVIYFQKDISEYRSKHYNSGYFSYEDNGFGPVVYEDRDLYNNLKNILDNDLRIDNIYKVRIDKTFKNHDDKNCERTFNEIIKLTDKEQNNV